MKNSAKYGKTHAAKYIEGGNSLPTNSNPALRGRVEVVVMTQADKEALEAELREIDAQEGPLSREVARMNMDKDDAQSATIVARRSELATLTRRRDEIVRTLSNAQVVEASGADTVSIGSRVLVQIAGQAPPVQLQICRNGNAKAGRITPESPIAKALLEGVDRDGRRQGAKEGDTVVAKTPSGPTEITVLSIISVDEGCNDT